MEYRRGSSGRSAASTCAHMPPHQHPAPCRVYESPACRTRWSTGAAAAAAAPPARAHTCHVSSQRPAVGISSTSLRLHCASLEPAVSTALQNHALLHRGGCRDGEGAVVSNKTGRLTLEGGGLANGNCRKRSMTCRGSRYLSMAASSCFSSACSWLTCSCAAHDLKYSHIGHIAATVMGWGGLCASLAHLHL